MKIAITTFMATALLAGSAFVSVASAGPLTAEREARTARIEALRAEVASGRLTRSQKILAQLQIASLEAEDRKQRRQEDRVRDKQAALKRRGLL
ncbi:MAG: hypothetical protein ACPG47_02025 [Leucothrix sp.]